MRNFVRLVFALPCAIVGWEIGFVLPVAVLARVLPVIPIGVMSGLLASFLCIFAGAFVAPDKQRRVIVVIATAISVLLLREDIFRVLTHSTSAPDSVPEILGNMLGIAAAWITLKLRRFFISPIDLTTR